MDWTGPSLFPGREEHRKDRTGWVIMEHLDVLVIWKMPSKVKVHV